MERFGLVGLPNAGKSSLFNALTGASAAVAAHPFSTTESQVGIARVPDERLVRLAEMSASRKVVHATAEFVDIAGLQKGSSQGEGLGNRFLHGIREVDAVCYVLRAFEDDNVPGNTDPLADLTTLELELVLADAASAESQLERRRKAARSDKSLGRRGRRARGGRRRSCRTPRRCTGPACRARPSSRPAALLPADREEGHGRGQPGRGPAGRPRADRQAGGRRAGRRRGGARRLRAARGGGGGARRRRTEPSCSRAWAWARARSPG